MFKSIYSLKILLEHIAEKVKKANSMMGLIRRSFSYLGLDMFNILYTLFVRPHLEYAQAVWSPHLKRDDTLIERVQQRATKLVEGLRVFSHTECLQTLNLPTLAFRRNINDMVEIYKHFHIPFTTVSSAWIDIVIQK